MRDLIDYRAEFPILEHTTYLINHSLAAMPVKAEERLAEYARMWKERGIRSWGEGWWEMPMTVGDQIGATVAEVAIAWILHQPGVTSAIVGSSNPERARSNGGAAEFHLDGEILQVIESLIPLGPGFS